MQNISPTMDGTIVSVGVSLVICVVWTLIWPEKNPDTWGAYKSIELQDEELVVDHYEEDPHAMDKALKVPFNCHLRLSVWITYEAMLSVLQCPDCYLSDHPCQCPVLHPNAGLLNMFHLTRS